MRPSSRIGFTNRLSLTLVGRIVVCFALKKPALLLACCVGRDSFRTRKQQAKMKIRASVKRLCEFCYVVRRRAKVFVYCSKNPKARCCTLFIHGMRVVAGDSCSCFELSRLLLRRFRVATCQPRAAALTFHPFFSHCSTSNDNCTTPARGYRPLAAQYQSQMNVHAYHPLRCLRQFL